MTKLFTKVQNAIAARKSDEEGASMVEYGLLVGLIAVVVARRRRRRSATSIDDLFTDDRRRALMPIAGERERRRTATAPAACGFHSKIRPKEVQHDEATA